MEAGSLRPPSLDYLISSTDSLDGPLLQHSYSDADEAAARFTFFPLEESVDEYARSVCIEGIVCEDNFFLGKPDEPPKFSLSFDTGEDFEPDECFLAQLPFSLQEKPQIPDISGALGKRIEKQELKALEEFAIREITFAVFDNELCAYLAPCWKRLDGHTCTIRLKELFCRHKLDRHLGSADYKELYRSLLTNPQLQQGSIPDPPLHRLNLLDATLNLENFTFYQHNPKDGFFAFLNISKSDILDPGSGTTFEAFIASVSNGDPAVRQQVLELVALACTGYQIKAFFLLVGPSGTGKSQFARFLIELLGHEKATSIGGIHELGSKFALADTEEKSLAVCMDLPNTPLPPTAIGTLKVAVGNDAKKLEAKYKNPKTVYRSPLWLFASNFPLHIPNVEREDAFLQRMVIIPFLNVVPPEKQVQQLYKKLLEESPYIVRESIKAYQALMRKNFVLTQSAVPSEYLPGESRAEVSAVQEFLDTYCTYDSEATITTERLYQAFLLGSKSGNSLPINKIAFGKILAGLMEHQNDVFEVKRAENTDRRGYRGIRLNDDTALKTFN